MYAIPNGGFRAKSTAAKLKAEGVKPGVPDIFLPVALRNCHGMYIEMKRKGGNTSKEQRNYATWLIERGYMVCLCYGCDEAIKAVENYYSKAKSSICSQMRFEASPERQASQGQGITLCAEQALKWALNARK